MRHPSPRRAAMTIGALVLAFSTAMLTAAAAAPSPAAASPDEDAPAQPIGSTRLISLRADGTPATKQSYAPSISDDGRYVAFGTEENFLTGPDRAPCCQAVRYDRKTKTTEVVSVTRKGDPAPKGGNEPVMSADGNIVAFWSSSPRLVRGDTNESPDVFVRDMTTGKTTLVSRTPDGKPGNNDSRIASISADGTRIAFQSDASDLASGDKNQITDIFVYDTTTKKVTLVSRGLDGKSALGQSLQPEISADGTHVVYFSGAENIVDGDHNGFDDVFSYDIAAATTQIISVAEDGSPSDGGSFNPSVSGDGLFVTFWSFATNFSPNDHNDAGDVFVRSTDSVKITLVSHTTSGLSGDGESDDPTISTDGRTIAFQSAATDLVTGDTNGVNDVFWYNIGTGTVGIATQGTHGGPTNDSSFLPSLSADGDFVAFESIASNLVHDDPNGVSDVFVKRLA